uniref:Uncharacterized protein n=1 Tax=Enterobacter cloacae TaxID=550 RepID=A0A482M527_ENTCL|nr:hypothetical protein [Enterobacter cloacae]
MVSLSPFNSGERAVRRLRRTGRDFRSRGAGEAGARGLY